MKRDWSTTKKSNDVWDYSKQARSPVTEPSVSDTSSSDMVSFLSVFFISVFSQSTCSIDNSWSSPQMQELLEICAQEREFLKVFINIYLATKVRLRSWLLLTLSLHTHYCWSVFTWLHLWRSSCNCFEHYPSRHCSPFLVPVFQLYLKTVKWVFVVVQDSKLMKNLQEIYHFKSRL